MRPENPSNDQRDEAPDAQVPSRATRQPLTQRTYHSIIDQRIAAAAAEGAFDNLPGAGKPLQLEDDTMVPEEDRAAYRMLKNAGFAPPWIELQKEIRQEQAKLERWLDRANRGWALAGPWEHQRLRNEFRERLTEINRLILHFNLIVPPTVGQMPTLRIEDELARLGT